SWWALSISSIFFRDDVPELSGICRHDLDHAVDHLLGVHLALGSGEEIIKTLAQIGAFGEVLVVVEPAEGIVRHGLVVAGVVGPRTDGLDFDAVGSQLLLKCLSYRLQRMFGRDI